MTFDDRWTAWADQERHAKPGPMPVGGDNRRRSASKKTRRDTAKARKLRQTKGAFANRRLKG